jgi:O-antigen/teichoic acid export membrane protein
MFAFAGWGCVGNTGFTMKDQGSNIILNLFGGTTVNAARGIAAQVNTIVSSFASNFTMAMNPQVTKLYASGEYDKSRVLAFAGSKYAFLLLSIIVIPFLTNEHYLLTLWLGDIPEYTDMFVCIALICSLIYSLSNTISTAIMATGNVKWFQIGLAIILLSELPISYIILKNGGTLIQAMYPSVFTTLISVIFRIVLIHKLVPSYNITEYCVTVMLRCFIFFLISILLSLYIRSFYGDGFLTFVVTTAFSVIIVLSLIYIIGLNRSERKFVLNKILTIIRK